MKIRSSFVSNSSSSSFIISENAFNNLLCSNCKRIIETLFEKRKAQEIVLEDDYWDGDIQNYYNEYDSDYKPPMYKHCKNDDTVYFKKIEMDEAQTFMDVLKAMGIEYEYEEH